MVGIAVSLPACLVTDHVQFEPPADVPPAVTSASSAEHPLTEIIDLSRLSAGGDAGVGPRRLTLELEVRDPDVDQELFYKVYANYSAATPVGAIVERTIPPDPPGDSDRTTRAVSFDLPVASLSQRCNRIEILVSSLFQFGSREPVTPGDLGTAVFWAVQDGTVTAEECPLRP